MDKDKLKVIEEFGLQVREVESGVYEVLNTEVEISVEELQWKLGECTLMTSFEKGVKKLETGIGTTLARVYYVLTQYKNVQLNEKYYDLAVTRFGEVLQDSYKYDPEATDFIGTIYREGEY